MLCKNCHIEISTSNNFCSNCGAKVVKERITVKGLLVDFLNEFFGWDNKYLNTLILMVKSPDVVLGEYVDGVRKKYVSPFVFIAIGAALATLCYNLFVDEYLEMSRAFNSKELELFNSNMDFGDKTQAEYIEEQVKINNMVQNFMLKYFNIITFLFVPFYGFISYLVYRKPYNYGEHLIFTCYVQGTLFISSIVLFVSSLLISPYVFSLNIPLAVLFYLYAYGKLYKLSVGQSLGKLMVFIGVMAVASILMLLIATGVGVLISFLK